MLVCEQAEEQAAKLNGAPVRHRHGHRLAPRRDRHRRRPPQGALRPTRHRHRRDEDGIGKGSGRSISGVDLGAAVLAAKDSGLAGRRRRPRDGGGSDDRSWRASSHSATSSTSGSPQTSRRHRGDRALLLDALLAPGGVAGDLCDALDAAGPYGAGWPGPRVAAGPVRLLSTGIVGNGHVRGLACGDDGKSFKWIAFRSAATALGQALLASPADTRWWLAGTIKRDEWNGGNAAEMHVEDAALA